MQANRRLVQHIHDAGQARADLARQSDALRLAAGQRVGRAVERQIVQPNVDQKLQPGTNLLDDLFGDGEALAAQAQLVKKAHRLAQRLAGDAVQGLSANEHIPRLTADACALAGRARLAVEITRQLLTDHGGVGLAVAPLEVGDDALETVFSQKGVAALAEIGERNGFAARAIQHHPLVVLAQRLERRLHREPVVPRQALQHHEVELIAPVPALDRARRQRQLWKRHHPLRVKKGHAAQAVALGTGANRIVKREQPRFQF